MTQPVCIFCHGAGSNIRITQTSRWLSVWDGFPVVSGHALLIPFRHIERLFELHPDEWTGLWGIIAETDVAINDRFRGIEGYNFGINDGGVAGQTVRHLHVHMIPRRPGDVDDPRGGIRNMFAGAPRPWEK